MVLLPTGDDANTWSTQDKFLIVVETASMNESELVEYARKKGLFVEQIKAWKDACMNANGGVAQQSAQLNRELKESEKERKKLEKELLRKDKALAETAALLVLSEKPCNLVGQRGRSISASDRKDARPTSYCATGPNQVWTWDITYLNGPIKGIFYYLYLIIDLFSRDIVGWEVWEEQTAEHASELIKQACLKQGRLSTMPLVLHSDNGTLMKGATMLETLYALGITPSNSRPRVSNDNPYSESLFKTLKYRPNYQPKGFGSIEEARIWCARFVKWYRFEYHHSGIKFLTVAERHAGKSEKMLNKRHEVYEAAKAAHP